MPSIPVYNSPQVDRAPVDNAKQQVGGISARAFGASDTFREAEDLAGTYIKIQEKEGERAAAEEALRAQSNYQREVIGKQNEWRQRQGKNAEGVDKEADAYMAETAGKYIKELKDPRAVKLFDQFAMRQRNNMLDWSTSHVTQQREVALDVEINSAKQVAMDAALNDSRPQIVNQSIADIKAKNAFTANRKGYDDVWIQAQNSKDLEKLHAGILQNAMDQDSVGGVQGYLQAHGGEIDASLRAKAEKWVHNKVIDETAGAYADELIGNGVTYSEALQGARDKFSGDDEEKYVRRIKERYGEVEDMKRIQERELVDGINKKLYETGDITKLTNDDVQNVFAVDTARGLDLKTKRDKALEVKAKGGSFADESDYSALKQARDLVTNGDITDPKALAEYRQSLTESDYKGLAKMVEKRGMLDSNGAEAYYNLYLPDSLKEKKGEETDEGLLRKAIFMRDASEYVRDTHRPQDMQAFARDWFLQGTVKKSNWFADMFQDPSYQGEARAKGDAFTPKEALPKDIITQDYLDRREHPARTIQRTGMLNGRKVVQYSDGTTEYAE